MHENDPPDGMKKALPSRRHVTTACASCRDTKSRCDGMEPRCGQCVAKNRECTYRVKIDKRKISLRKTVELFCRRVRHLENVMSAHGIPIPDMESSDDQAMLIDLMTAYSLTCESQGGDSSMVDTAAVQSLASPQDSVEPATDHGDAMEGATANYILAQYPPGTMGTDYSLSNDATGFGSSQGVMNEPMFFDPTVEADWIWDFSTYAPFQIPIDSNFGFHNFAQSDSVLPEFQSNVAAMHTPVSPEDVEVTDEEEMPEVTNQFSDRLGTLLTTKPGETRFYGATSNLHLVHSRQMAEIPVTPEQQQQRVKTLLDLQGLGQDVDSKLLSHFIKLYFTWQNPIVHLIDQRAFEAAQADAREDKRASIYYSDLLVNAICALGALQGKSTRPHQSLHSPDFFASRARTLLDHELESPRICTVQALAAMSLYESATARDTRGWIYSGMAMRLALDLGLHVNTKPYEQNGRMSQREAGVRKDTFWGTYAIDRMWGIHLGRPLLLNSADFTVDIPEPSMSSGDQSFWSSYDSMGVVKGEERLKDVQSLVTERWISLLEIMSSLGHMLYSKFDASKIELQDLAEKTFNKMLSWEASLPDTIAVDMDSLTLSSRLPHVLMLHMHFALFKIVLHRPFVSKHYIQPRPRIGKGHLHAREMCVRSAVDISKLITCFKLQYSLHRCSVLAVHPIFSAALILVYAAVSESSSDAVINLQPHLETCCQALAELGDIFDNAARSLDILLAVKRTWQARMVVGLQGKRPHSRASAVSAMVTRKRTKT